MAAVWGELKRRNVVRVAVAYAVVSWLILQLTNVLMPLLGLPEWVDRLVFLLLVVGFPLALIFAWAFELTPEGLKKEKDVDRSGSITHITGRKLDFAIIAVLAVALVFFASTHQWSSETGHAETADKSIAVLAFTDLSPAEDQEYFSDGISEELLNVLSKIPGLRVAARTSSFQFKG
ncbi:MAG: adenylyl cyclase, partial [Proteobacteria bacterium]|nr:adenylyl cyclase [Pseudomonadota bacterium]